ncbi:hypothetical protein N9449_06955 [Oceanospirillaceae bacterium]|nr:hypothetical protein [Oceanospirillaceae bacterium]
MSKSTQQMSALTTQSLNQALNTVKIISGDRNKWETTSYAKASDMLYKIMGAVYDLYMMHKDDADVSPALKKQLKDDATKSGITFRSNNPHLIDLLVKGVFAGDQVSGDYKRISSYIRVLKIADQEGKSTAAELIQFIKELGGLEEVRRSNSVVKPKQDMKKVLASAQRKLDKETVLGSLFNIPEVVDMTTELKNKYVVLVGRVNASGEVEIKHMSSNTSVVNKAMISAKDALVKKETEYKNDNAAELKEQRASERLAKSLMNASNEMLPA